jgi:pimeloyl-ACP methyl ester carboxylesterase
MATILKAGGLYFLAAFGAGFVLGAVRVLWVAPRVGARIAELIEMPLMLAIIIAAAIWIVRRLAVPARTAIRLGMGGLALALMLVAEFAVMPLLRGPSMAEYAEVPDPLTGSLYYASLALFAVLPLFVRPPAHFHHRLLVVLLAVAAAVPAGMTYQSYRRDLALERMRVSLGSQLAETPCGPIEFASAGEGPAVLVVHGAGGGYDQGLDFAEELARSGFRVVTMSRFGYLRTPLPQDASPPAQADAHACLLDALKIERAAIIGASAGAPSTLQFALRHPKRTVAMLLLVPLAYAPRPGGAPAPEPSLAARFMFDGAVKSDLLFWLAMKTSPSTVVKALLATPPELVESAGAAEKERVERTMRHILPLSERQKGLRNDAAIATSLPRYDLEKIAAPTLVMSVADDLYGTYASARYTAEHIPGARFLGYESGGHMWVGHHQDVLAAARAFLGRPASTVSGTIGSGR